MLEICFHTQLYRVLKELFEKQSNGVHEILCLPYFLDEGDLSNIDHLYLREEIYQSVWGRGWKEILNQYNFKKYDMITKHHKARIWFSLNALEYCGLLYAVSLIKGCAKEISVVRCASYSLDSLNISFSSTGEIGIDDIPYLLKNEHLLTENEINEYVSFWRQLREENTGLRVWENGTVVSVADSYYDASILKGLPDLNATTAWLAGYLRQQGLEASASMLQKRIQKLIETGVLKLF